MSLKLPIQARASIQTVALTNTSFPPSYEQSYKYSGVDILYWYEHDDRLEDQHGRNEQQLKAAVSSNGGRLFRKTLDRMQPALGHPHWPNSADVLCEVVRKETSACLGPCSGGKST
jgi:hypothetical protein